MLYKIILYRVVEHQNCLNKETYDHSMYESTYDLSMHESTHDNSETYEKIVYTQIQHLTPFQAKCDIMQFKFHHLV